MVRIDMEKSLKALRVHSHDLQAVAMYLRVLGAETFKRMLSCSGDERAAMTGELRIIQKLLDILDNSADSGLVRSA